MAVVARVSLVKLAFALARELSDSSSEVHGSEFSISSHEEPKKKKLKDRQNVVCGLRRRLDGGVPQAGDVSEADKNIDSALNSRQTSNR